MPVTSRSQMHVWHGEVTCRAIGSAGHDRYAVVDYLESSVKEIAFPQDGQCDTRKAAYYQVDIEPAPLTPLYRPQPAARADPDVDPGVRRDRAFVGEYRPAEREPDRAQFVDPEEDDWYDTYEEKPPTRITPTNAMDPALWGKTIRGNHLTADLLKRYFKFTLGTIKYRN
eukprot:PhM_4_TR14086/c3_g1_i1/m.107058